MNTVAIIPARGGSKGIPRKNMRLIGGKPLIGYAIENALASSLIDVVVVTSDSSEVLAFASQYQGVLCLDRQSNLANDAVTLDPVIYDAICRIEMRTGTKFDTVVTLQPTSPLLSVDVLDGALDEFGGSDVDTLISAVNAPHLSWGKNADGLVVPNYEKRLNRQQLPPCYLETGAFLITRRTCVTEVSRLGEKVAVYEVPLSQAIDIDTKEDWIVCEAMLSRKRIAFRVDGYGSLGMGHIYRALTLAYELIEHDVVFICDSNRHLGVKKLRDANMHVIEVSDDDELLSWLDHNRIDIFVNDRLDTKTDYVSAVKQRVGRFVSFEDMGEGARKADAVVNAIYEGDCHHSNTFFGKRYVCLRDEFLVSKPNDFKAEVSRVLVTFGGTDPLDLTRRMYEIAKRWNESSVKMEFDFVLGSGYSGGLLESLPEQGIYVSRDIVRMSDHMRAAHMAVSSQGRTTFELASMGVPTLVLAQNEREQLHTFAQMDNGFINLGLGSDVSDEDIESALHWLVGAKSVRREMRNRMLSSDLRAGIKRVKRIILGEMS